LANPIYDVTFKALMSDPDVAKGLISRVLGRMVLKLHFSAQEFPIKDVRHQGETITLMRMDFAALIRDEHGREMNVLIEIQKAKLPEDIGRFRHYLGRQYMTPTEVDFLDDSSRPWTKENDPSCASLEGEFENDDEDAEVEKVYLPIFTIYLLNFKIEAPAAMVRVRRQFTNAADDSVLGDHKCHDSFLESLTHDAFVVQVPRLSPKPTNDLERTFALFNQRLVQRGDKHRLVLEDGTELEDDALLKKMMRILTKAAADGETIDRMDREDVLLEDQDRALRSLRRKLKSAELAQQQAEAEKRQAESEKRQAEAEKRQAEAEKRQAEDQTKLKLTLALEALVAQGVPESQAREILEIELPQ
jgi:hypothetical protein